MREVVDMFLWNTIKDVLPMAGDKVREQIYDVLHAQPTWRIADIEAMYY